MVRKSATTVADFQFPCRGELFDFLHSCFVVMVLICVAFGSAVMIFSFRLSTSRYLYYAFSYGYALCNILLGLVVFIFNCVRRVGIRRGFKWMLTKQLRRQPLNSGNADGCPESNMLIEKDQVVLQSVKAKQQPRSVVRSGYNSELTHDQSDAVSALSMATSVFLTANDTSRPSSLVGVAAGTKKDCPDKITVLTTVSETAPRAPSTLDRQDGLQQLDATMDCSSERDALLESSEQPSTAQTTLPIYENINACRPPPMGSAIELPNPRAQQLDHLPRPRSRDDPGKLRGDLFAGHIPVAVVTPFSPPSMDSTQQEGDCEVPRSKDNSVITSKPSFVVSPVSQPTLSDRLSVNSQSRSVCNSAAGNGSVPGELASFVPANWRPVKKGGRSASFYPYVDHNQRHLPKLPGEGSMTDSVSGVVVRQPLGSVSSRTTAPTEPSPQRQTSKATTTRSDSRKRRRRKRLDPNRPKFDDLPFKKAVVFIPIPETIRVPEQLRNETSV